MTARKNPAYSRQIGDQRAGGVARSGLICLRLPSHRLTLAALFGLALDNLPRLGNTLRSLALRVIESSIAIPGAIGDLPPPAARWPGVDSAHPWAAPFERASPVHKCVRNIRNVFGHATRALRAKHRDVLRPIRSRRICRQLRVTLVTLGIPGSALIRCRHAVCFRRLFRANLFVWTSDITRRLSSARRSSLG